LFLRLGFYYYNLIKIYGIDGDDDGIEVDEIAADE
jgi:hypothetical protein